jgi:predicted XRE-type DNA-binding protein
MKFEQFESVWDAVEDTPEEANNMKLRAQLMMKLRSHVQRTGLTQGQAAKLFGVTQPRIADLMCGRINHFNFEALVEMATCAGFTIEMEVTGVA